MYIFETFVAYRPKDDMRNLVPPTRKSYYNYQNRFNHVIHILTVTIFQKLHNTFSWFHYLSLQRKPQPASLTNKSSFLMHNHPHHFTAPLSHQQAKKKQNNCITQDTLN